MLSGMVLREQGSRSNGSLSRPRFRGLKARKASGITGSVDGKSIFADYIVMLRNRPRATASA
jgi:hypothetical protein